MRAPPGPAYGTALAEARARSRCCAAPAPSAWHMDVRNRSHAVYRRDCGQGLRLLERSQAQVLPAHGRGHQCARAGARAPHRRRAAGPHREFRKQLADGDYARRPAGARLRHRARGGQAHARPAPFRRAADRRHGAAPGQDRRDEDRRRQDAGRHAARLPQRARRQAACTSSPSTTTSPSATPSGWAASTGSSASPSASSCTSSTTSSGAQQYACDVTYGTNNELGFDYLRDNMKMRAAEMVQRGHIYAIVDEVDSILIDEARTPLIISGPLEDRADLYIAVDELMKRLVAEHDKIEKELRKTPRQGRAEGAAQDQGPDRARREAAPGRPSPKPATSAWRSCSNEKDLLKGGSLYDIENVTVVHHVNQALKAHKLFQRDRDYIVKGGEVVIIDEFTGRMMQGRRYSEGLHQALEAKEHVEIQPENQTLASITFQNYFRLYKKLAGMTGTAATEANEFMDIYGLDVLEIPTNVPVDRTDEHDEVYRTAKEKSARHRRRDRRLPPPRPADPGRHRVDREVGAAVRAAEGPQVHPRARPLPQEAGRQAQGRQGGRAQGASSPRSATTSSSSPRKNSGDPIPHQVLNARYHEQEAHIIAQAGVPGSGDDRHQHGRPRHRHPARRQRPVPRPRLAQGGDRGWPHERRPRRRRQSRGAAAMGRRCPQRRRRVDRRAPQGVGRGQHRRLDQGADPARAASRRPRRSPGSGPAIEAERRPVAEKRAEIARELRQGPVGRPAQRPRRRCASRAGRITRLREEAREWQRGSQRRVAASAPSTRRCSAS